MITDYMARRFRFGPFEVDLLCGELRKLGLKIRIQPQPLKMLVVLIERPGELVSRDELRERLWPSAVYLDFELGLNRSMHKLRGALLDSANSPRYIETLQGRGYRFIAPVTYLIPTAPTLGFIQPLYAHDLVFRPVDARETDLDRRRLGNTQNRTCCRSHTNSSIANDIRFTTAKPE